MSVWLGCVFESATGFAGSSMTMASSIDFVCTFTASDSWLSSVYCSKVPSNGAVVDSTALTGCGGGHVTCLTAARLAASFHVLPVVGVFWSPSGKRFNYLCNAFRGEPGIFSEPVEDYFILVHPFIPFGTCGWGSQPHTAIISVW